MSVIGLVGGVVFGLLLAEQRLSRRNERALRARSALVPSGDVYALMAVVYPAAFLAMVAEGFWRAAGQPAAAPAGQGEPAWLASGVLLFCASKALKYWAIGTLGDRWTFRVIVEPGRPLVNEGPYRYVAHPNYLAVVGELAGVALMTGATVSGPVSLAAFGVLLWLRVRFEEKALRGVIR